MSTASRNLAIVRRQRRPQNVTPGSSRELEELQLPDKRYILIAAAWNKVVDVLGSSRGSLAVRAYCLIVLQRQGHADLEINGPITAGVADVFVRKITETSPLLVDDATFENQRQVSEHPRGSWSGSYASFDPRTQAIKLNSHWVSNAKQALDSFLGDREDNNCSATFQLALFKLVHAFCHETGHLLQTFLGRGQDDTPPGLSGGAATRHQESSGGEAGEAFEVALFGGLVDFYNDDSVLGNLSTGFPWVTPRQGEAWRMDLYSVGLFLQPDWTGDGNILVSRSPLRSAVSRGPSGRPRVEGIRLASARDVLAPISISTPFGGLARLLSILLQDKFDVVVWQCRSMHAARQVMESIGYLREQVLLPCADAERGAQSWHRRDPLRAIPWCVLSIFLERINTMHNAQILEKWRDFCQSLLFNILNSPRCTTSLAEIFDGHQTARTITELGDIEALMEVPDRFRATDAAMAHAAAWLHTSDCSAIEKSEPWSEELMGFLGGNTDEGYKFVVIALCVFKPAVRRCFGMYCRSLVNSGRSIPDFAWWSAGSTELDRIQDWGEARIFGGILGIAQQQLSVTYPGRQAGFLIGDDILSDLIHGRTDLPFVPPAPAKRYPRLEDDADLLERISCEHRSIL